VNTQPLRRKITTLGVSSGSSEKQKGSLPTVVRMPLPKTAANSGRFKKLSHTIKGYELNRYKHLDAICHKVLNFVGIDNLSAVYESRLNRFFPGTKWISALLLLRNKAISENETSHLLNYFKESKLRYIHYSLADWLLKHRVYNSTTEDFFEKANTKSREININIRYTDFISQKYGFRSEKLEKSIRRLMMPDVFMHLTKNQKLRLAAMLFQRKNDTLGNKVIRNIGKGFILKNTTSPYMLNKIAANKIYKDDFIVRGSECYKIILRTRSRFEQMIIESRNSFCLVGNAPTELNLGKGKIIDSKKLVIRINNYSLDYPEDYGTKQNIWVRVANGEIGNSHARQNDMVVFAANNFATKRRDAANYLLPLTFMQKDHTVIPSHIFHELIDKLGGLPSTGLATAYWIYKIIGPIPKHFLFGFSHLQQEANFKAHYFVDSAKAGTHLHQWDKEIRIFNQITR
jgi:hypothetical protein